MDLLAHIDLYCERTDPGLWAEPLNALSNIGFLIAAALLWRRASLTRGSHMDYVLALLIALIGVCSGLFHVFGTVWGMWLDVGGISLFILFYLQQYLRRLALWPRWACALGLIAFLLLSQGFERIGGLGLNGSETYLPPCATLIVLALWSRRHTPAATRWLWMAAGSFLISLTLRTLDMALCASWPAGLHFGWHLLNACVLYFCVRGLMAKSPSS